MMNIIQIYKTSPILQGFSATTIWRGASKIILILATLYCSNVMAKDDFGTFSYIKNTLNILILMCATNFSSLCVKFASESVSSQVSLKRLYLLYLFVICISILSGIIILAIPSSTLLYLLDNQDVVYYIKIIVLFLPIFIIQPIISGTLTGFKKFKLVGIYEALSAVIYLVMIVLAIHLFGSKGAILSLLIYYFLFSIAGLMVLWFFNRKENRLVPVNSVFSEWRSIYKMIIPMFLMAFIDAPIDWTGQSMVARYESYAAVGIITIVAQIRTFTILLPTYFFQTFIPFVAELNVKRKYKDYFDKYKKVFRILFPLSLIAFLLLLCCGKFLLRLFNPIFVDYYDVYCIGVALLPLMIVQILFKVNLTVKEHQRAMMIISFFSGLISLVVLFSLIQLGYNPLKSFFVAQIFQYIVQISISTRIFIMDKNKCIA